MQANEELEDSTGDGGGGGGQQTSTEVPTIDVAALLRKNSKHATKAKLMVVGDSRVGKTRLVTRFLPSTDPPYDEDRYSYVPTFFADFDSKVTIEEMGIKVIPHLWDTPGIYPSIHSSTLSPFTLHSSLFNLFIFR